MRGGALTRFTLEHQPLALKVGFPCTTLSDYDSQSNSSPALRDRHDSQQTPAGTAAPVNIHPTSISEAYGAPSAHCPLPTQCPLHAHCNSSFLETKPLPDTPSHVRSCVVRLWPIVYAFMLQIRPQSVLAATTKIVTGCPLLENHSPSPDEVAT
jgi:hypothetical protein